jgi:hypothetical protein
MLFQVLGARVERRGPIRELRTGLRVVVVCAALMMLQAVVLTFWRESASVFSFRVEGLGRKAGLRTARGNGSRVGRGRGAGLGHDPTWECRRFLARPIRRSRFRS